MRKPVCLVICVLTLSAFLLSAQGGSGTVTPAPANSVGGIGEKGMSPFRGRMAAVNGGSEPFYAGRNAEVPVAEPVPREDRLTAQIVYHGNAETKVFHRPGCRYYDCKNCVVQFRSKDEALRAGYRPCKVCKP